MLQLPAGSLDKKQRYHVQDQHIKMKIAFQCTYTATDTVFERHPQDKTFHCVCDKQFVAASALVRHHARCKIAEQTATDLASTDRRGDSAAGPSQLRHQFEQQQLGSGVQYLEEHNEHLMQNLPGIERSLRIMGGNLQTIAGILSGRPQIVETLMGTSAAHREALLRATSSNNDNRISQGTTTAEAVERYLNEKNLALLKG